MITPEDNRKRWQSVDEWLVDNGHTWRDVSQWLPDRHANTDDRRPGRGPAQRTEGRSDDQEA